MIVNGNPSEKYPVNVRISQGSIVGRKLFLLYINDFPGDAICNVAIYAYNTTLYSNYDQASDLRQQLELAFELESDLGDTLNWYRKWLVDINAGETRLVPFDRFNNSGTIDMKMDGSIPEEKSCFKKLELYFFSKLDWGSYSVSMSQLLTLPVRKLEP